MIILLMGVSGSGKTKMGAALADRLGWTFADADDFHSAENKQKMADGIALTDSDRAPWLDALHRQISAWLLQNQNAVLACSALKQTYREALLIHPAVHLVYLKGSADLITARLRGRSGHYAGETLLSSQFAALEEPSAAITIDITHSQEEILNEIVSQLNLPKGPHEQ
ncbi:MAG: gluconokinase [Candidatus Acidiferrum sp.]